MKTIEKMTLAAVADALRNAAEALHPSPVSGSVVLQRETSARCRDKAEPKREVGGRDAPADRELFGAAHVYVAGCSSLALLSRKLGLPVFKIGATQQPLLARQEDLALDRYAAGFRKKGGSVVIEEGFDDWEMRQIRRIQIDAGSPVEIVPRALRVQLTTPFNVFEGALRAALAHRALETWMSSPGERGRLARLGVEQDEVRRFTVYGFGDEVRTSRCAELYVVRPREDLPEIIDVIAGVLRAERQG